MSEISNQKESFIFLKTVQSGSDFVGITVTQNEKSITFPMGYSLSNSNLSAQKITKNERKEILNLIKSISECRNFKKGERISSLNGKTAGDFPIKSIFFIIEDFLNRGTYYTEKETLYTKSTSGKISWPCTIKNLKPVISESGITFLDFIVRKNRIQENLLVTEIHKYCVYKSFELLGFLFVPGLPEKGMIDESNILKNKKYYADFLQEKIDTTHLESSIELFCALKDFINGFDCESEIKNASYGTQCFQVVWETLVEKTFGNVGQGEKEKYFYPKTRWTFLDGKTRTNAPLRPDTIMILKRDSDEEKTCFILDAKYYSFAALQNQESGNADDETHDEAQNGSIPGTDSIQKQITYAEFIDSSIDNNKNPKRPKKFRFAPQKIWNVFILPENNSKNAKELFSYKGFATSEWKDNSKNYHKIHAVTLDTKFLLENAGRNNAEIRNQLAAVILPSAKSSG